MADFYAARAGTNAGAPLDGFLRRSTDDRFYVRTLVELASHLGVETVAEWVDDEMQASMLRDWGVTYLQGHLVGRAEVVEPSQVAPRRLAAG